MRPIIFSTPMVKAILEGRKTQTRRVVKPLLKDCSEIHRVFKEAEWRNRPARFVQSFTGANSWYCYYCGNGTNAIGEGFKCPYGKVGDMLYVRETVGRHSIGSTYLYKTDEIEPGEIVKWRPSIHMPKAAARIFLKITDIRVEALRNINEVDAFAEGIDAEGEAYNKAEHFQLGGSPIQGGSPAVFAFINLWQSINGPDSWNENPWVWVINFERTNKPS